MAKYNGPKDRLSRREGIDIFGKGAKRNQSQYGKQLREKQKVKRIYGILEKQFRIYVEKALKSKGNTGEALLVLLEKRLDNVVYKLGFATTRPMARQLVSHRHVLVNGKKVNIPSFQVKAGDVVSLTPAIIEMSLVKKLVSDTEYEAPSWLERKVSLGKVTRDPIRSDIIELVSEQDIVEFYSR